MRARPRSSSLHRSCRRPFWQSCLTGRRGRRRCTWARLTRLTHLLGSIASYLPHLVDTRTGPDLDHTRDAPFRHTAQARLQVGQDTDGILHASRNRTHDHPNATSVVCGRTSLTPKRCDTDLGGVSKLTVTPPPMSPERIASYDVPVRELRSSAAIADRP